jgi:DNA-directed RNA polymerase subunit RPC12/RpoP
MSPLLLTVTASLAVSVLVTVLLHFLTRRHLLDAAAEKAVYLKCATCKTLVARYEQLSDHSIRCVNCKRRAELIHRNR